MMQVFKVKTDVIDFVSENIINMSDFNLKNYFPFDFKADGYCLSIYFKILLGKRKLSY